MPIPLQYVPEILNCVQYRSPSLAENILLKCMASYQMSQVVASHVQPPQSKFLAMVRKVRKAISDDQLNYYQLCLLIH